MNGTPDTAGTLRTAFVEGATTATAICDAVLAQINANAPPEALKEDGGSKK